MSLIYQKGSEAINYLLKGALFESAIGVVGFGEWKVVRRGKI